MCDVAARGVLSETTIAIFVQQIGKWENDRFINIPYACDANHLSLADSFWAIFQLPHVQTVFISVWQKSHILFVRIVA